MLKNLTALVAVAGLAFTPVVAQANTRAAESTVSLSQLGAGRTSSPIGNQAEELEGEFPLIAIIAGLAAIIAVIELVDSKGIFD